MRYLFLCILVTLLAVPEVWGQRVVASISPTEESLKFDSNAVGLTTLGLGLGDFNFSPNVVFTPDSLRGFVAYPGREEEGLTVSSNKVMAFDAVNGELLALIEVGPSPVSLTLTPDGGHVGVVSLFLRENTPNVENEFEPPRIGSVSLIDVQTFEVQSLELDQVLFSFFNNIAFSADGSTGFVASAGSDEILRFDVGSMTETGPRIELPGATNAASITMAADGSFFTVVLPGSNVLDTSEQPDSIQIIDPASFSIIGSIIPDPLVVERTDGTSIMIPHDFFGLNNVSITPDNKWAIIGDREISRSSGFAALTTDHALIIDLEQREVAQVITVGGGASASSVSPTGDRFALVSAIEVSLFDPSEEGRRRISTGTSQFLASSRPIFSPDGRKIYVASPILDLLNVYDVENAVTTDGIPVGEDFLRPSFDVPAGPLDLAFTANGDFLSVVNFNGNNVELLKNTYRLTAPQMIADNVDSVPDDETGEPVPIPPSERFFSGIAVTNSGEDDAEVIMTAFGFLQGPREAARLILANPNPITVCAEGELGQTTINWDVRSVLEEDEEQEEVEVRVGSETGNLFARGDRTGSALTGEWVSDGMTFYLLNRLNGELLDTITVTFTELGCPPPVVVVIPNPVQVCDDGGVGSATLSWDATDFAEEVEIRVGSVDGTLFLTGEPAGFQQSVEVTEGMVFVLVGDTGNELDREVVTLTDEFCPLALTRILKPDQQMTLLANSFLSTNSLVDPDSVDFSGWVDLDSDDRSVAGVFLTFDGDLGRIDGGPISSETLALAFLPEVRIRDDFTTQIDVVNPNNQTIRVVFDLFDLTGSLVASVLRSVAPEGRITLPVLGKDETLGQGLFDNATGFNRILASPNPIQVCGGGRSGQTTISWNATGIAEQVEIRVGSVDGSLFGAGPATGSAETGQWVTEGMVFYLLDGATGDLLDVVTVSFTEEGCPPPVLTATPNPIRVCNMGFGLTNLTWDTTGVATSVEVRADAADGTLLGGGGPTGTIQTGRWVTDGMTFYLLDGDDGSVLDTLTATLTEEGCPLVDFEDGYIRVASPGAVIAETMLDPKRMAVLGAQQVYPEQTRFTIPHFVAFGGSDTILKLIHPSSLPLGGAPVTVDEGEEEPEEPDPIKVSVSLRDDDGNLGSEPVELELPHGVSVRRSVKDLFGLVDKGTIQSGWIEITTDIPGLVGSAEIQAFDGEALTAIPLQPVQNSKFVFSHVARGFGFSTGLAVVHSGSEPATVVLELRNPGSELLGTVGPVTLDPGNRLVGLISELFPNSGELSGGTVKVRSDVPVTGVELFYGDDMRVLSAVPPQRFD